MRDPLWKVGAGVKENAAVFAVLGFLAGTVFTFAACTTNQSPNNMYGETQCSTR